MSNQLAVITINTLNYGGILQAYALQKTINSLGYDCVTLRVDPKASKKRFDKALVSFVYHTFFSAFLSDKRRRKRTRLFLSKLIRSQRCNERQTKKLLHSSKFEAIVIGSDQVWNDKMFNNTDIFFYPFEKKAPLLAYAASFGYSFEKFQPSSKHVELIKRFDHVSVREKDALDFLENQNSIPCCQVLDPTLLIEKTEWLEIARDYSAIRVDEPFGLVYLMPGDKTSVSFLKNRAIELSKKTGVKLIIIGFAERDRLLKPVFSMFGVGPAEWLYLFANAQWIMTNSFHGTVFSLHFGKPFYATVNTQSTKNYPQRIINLLERADALDHLLDVSTSDKPILPPKATVISALFRKDAEDSKQWLKEALNSSLGGEK